MKQLTCEMCGSAHLIKQDGAFVCQECGCQYSVEEAKKLMNEGVVEVQGTVKVDTSDEIANLYMVARRAKDSNNRESAARYYDMILIKDPNSWEATFYTVYFQAASCKIAEIQSAAISVTNNISTVLNLIKDTLPNKEEQKKAYVEVANKVIEISQLFFNEAKKHYKDDTSDGSWASSDSWTYAYSAVQCICELGDLLDEMYGSDTEANNRSVFAWKQAIIWLQYFQDNIPMFVYGNEIKRMKETTVPYYVSQIRKYDSSYTIPAPQKSGGCYVATAVYGSYDCPQVWTLRRYRDYTLDETWYGRLFIKTYYAISPTLVKWFGDTEWFKKMWKGKLDRMVAKLQSNGVESTPYEDKY
jgi:hypothetical protein